MKLLLMGVDHRMAPVAVRERISFADHEVGRFLEGLLALPLIREGVLLSTCNRTEILAVYDKTNEDNEAFEVALADYLCRFKGLVPLARSLFYAHHNEAALRHLFRVASGLESMILGEAQILGQVRDAYHLCCMAASNGVMINKVMHGALSAGKRVRSETEIGLGAVSVSLAAVERLRDCLGTLSDKSILLLGAGEMARLTAQHLAAKKAGRILIANRTPERAAILAEEAGGEAVSFSGALHTMGQCDGVISAIRSEGAIFSQAELALISAVRQTALPVVDMGVPRTFPPESEALPGFMLYDIDHLNQQVDATLERRRAALPQAERIIEEELERLRTWHRSKQALPMIRQLEAHAERVRLEEMARLSGLLDKKRFLEIDEMTQHLVQEILREPIRRLRESGEAPLPSDQHIADSVKQVFQLQA